jgi:GNAT superfamily N-acetyltransferase
MPLAIERMTESDFHEVLRDITDFWGSDRALHLHHPMLIREFGDTALVVRDSGKVAAYFCGFFSQTGPVAYGHLAGVRQSYQRKGLGQLLWNHFITLARQKGCVEIKGITSTTNQQSIDFHTKKLGMSATLVRDYGGPGKDYIVFRRAI